MYFVGKPMKIIIVVCRIPETTDNTILITTCVLRSDEAGKFIETYALFVLFDKSLYLFTHYSREFRECCPFNCLFALYNLLAYVVIVLLNIRSSHCLSYGNYKVFYPAYNNLLPV